MAIQIGEKIPDGALMRMGADGPEEVTTAALFGGKKVMLFAVPGAFTPTCSAKHVPGYLTNHDALKAKGVDAIACVSVNDAFVMGAWASDQGAGDKVMMLADGSAAFTNSIGLALDLTERGMGVRSQRYAMIVEDGVVRSLDLELNPGAVDISGAESQLAKL